MMRVYLSGQRSFGAAVYGLLRDAGVEVAGVCSPRGEDKLTGAALRDGAPWLPAGELKAETLPGGVDLIVAAHSHDFIGRRTRDKATLGAIGYHPSLLPLHRGRDAVRWSIKLRERVTGGTVFWLNDTVDGGPVAAQEHVLIDPGWGATELWREALFPLGLRLLRKTLGDIGRGVLVRVPQDARLATWEPALDQPPLFRPDLLQIGNAWAGYRVVADFEEWEDMPRGM